MESTGISNLPKVEVTPYRKVTAEQLQRIHQMHRIATERGRVLDRQWMNETARVAGVSPSTVQREFRLGCYEDLQYEVKAAARARAKAKRHIEKNQPTFANLSNLLVEAAAMAEQLRPSSLAEYSDADILAEMNRRFGK